MLAISVKTNIEQLTAQLNAVQQRQVPFATAQALTQTALRVKVEQQREMREVFDRPTPYTLGSVFTQPANKSNLTARVGLKAGSPAERFLQAEIKGGERPFKRFEAALQNVGALPSGYFAVPGSGAELDQYGNMSRKQITQILQYFQAFPEDGYKKNLTDKRRSRLARGTKRKLGVSYFVGQPGGGKLPLGVWQRTHFGHGSAIKAIVIFVHQAQYQKRFDFFRVAETTVRRDFGLQFRASLLNALATAR